MPGRLARASFVLRTNVAKKFGITFLFLQFHYQIQYNVHSDVDIAVRRVILIRKCIINQEQVYKNRSGYFYQSELQ